MPTPTPSLTPRYLRFLWLYGILFQLGLGVALFYFIERPINPIPGGGAPTWDPALFDDALVMGMLFLSILNSVLGLRLPSLIKPTSRLPIAQWALFESTGLIGAILAVLKHNPLLAVPSITLGLVGFLLTRRGIISVPC